MFKQFLQASALQFVQIDSCRVGSINENLAIILMAAKFNGDQCEWQNSDVHVWSVWEI